jgi:hypothetical protein
VSRALRRYLAHPGIPKPRDTFVVACPVCGERYELAGEPPRMPNCLNGCGRVQPAEPT